MASAQSAMLSGPTKKIFLKFLLPSLGAMAINSLYNLVDTVFIGIAEGSMGLAALTVVMPIFTLINATGVFLGVGGSIMFSVARGKGDKKSRTFFTAAISVALAMGLLYFAILNIWLNPILRLFGANNELMPLVAPYARVVALACPLLLINQFIVVFVRNDGAPAIAMAAGVSNGLINIILDYVFVCHLNMGMPGTVIATIAGVSVSLLICSSRFFAKSSGLRLDFKGIFKAVPQIFVSGGATFVIDIAPAITTIFFINMLQKYGGAHGLDYIAAYGVICNLLVVYNAMLAGVCVGVQPLMSINHGAGNKSRVKKFFALGIISATLISILMYIASAVAPQIYLKLFTSDNYTAETLKIVPSAVRFYGLVLLAMGHNLMLGYYYQSTLKKGRSMLVTLLRGLVFTVIFVFMFPAIWGVKAMWFVMPAAEAATLIVALTLWRLDVRKTKNTPLSAAAAQ